MAESETPKAPVPTFEPADEAASQQDAPKAAVKVVEANEGGEKGKDKGAEKGAQPEGVTTRLVAAVREAVPGHEHTVIGLLVGLVVAILIFAVGFWRTLLIVLFATAGAAVGQYLDGDPKIIRAVQSFFTNRSSK